ncbi:MAG: hypothetical protein M3461_03220 [Pseudomonadota bacterium]|nr:hypothetical protein [Pseudomonadota bacterium]
MNRRNRTGRRAAVARAAMALAAVSATLAVSPPAEAHPTVSGPHCESGDGYFSCIITITGSVPPVDIRWYINGRHAPQFDDRRWVDGGCPIGSRVGVKVVVTDATGVPVSKGKAVLCHENTP